VEMIEEFLPGLGEGETGAHRAMFDTKVVQLLCMKMLEKKYKTFSRMSDSLRNPVLLECMPFGDKHKGDLFEDILKHDPSYIRWLNRQPWVKAENPDLFYTLQQLQR